MQRGRGGRHSTSYTRQEPLEYKELLERLGLPAYLDPTAPKIPRDILDLLKWLANVR